MTSSIEPDGTTAGSPEVPGVRARELLALLAKGIRARQIYNSNNPVFQRFVGALRDAFAATFERVPKLRVQVEEHQFRVGDEVITIGQGRENLAFFFYKDGIRQLEFLPGFETEIEKFLDIVNEARQASPDDDDLVSRFWEEEFESFNYSYVDLLDDGVDLPSREFTEYPAIPEGIVAAELAGGGDAPHAGTGALPPGMLSSSDFQETLYFLDEADLEVLRAEVAREWARDLRRDTLNALFDRLEDGAPPRQLAILEILRQLLPAFIIRGHLAAAAYLISELTGLLAREGLFAPEVRAEAEALIAQLSTPTVLEQLIDAAAVTRLGADADALPVFFSHLGPAAFPALLRAVETTAMASVRDHLGPVLDRLGSEFGTALIGQLESDDEVVAAGAARVIGRLRLAPAAPALTRLLARPSAEARLAAVEALVAIRSASAVQALQNVLRDPVREVRIAAARGLGALRYQPARPIFEEILEGKALREADLTEKLAFFEAYARLAGVAGIPLLERILHSRGLLGRRPPAELRACAATALGHIPAPAARACLERARDESDPVVRGAVLRALRQEVHPS